MNHIALKNAYDCCGCASCADACPKACITMLEDIEGFRYPKINPSICVDCGKCLSVCPINNAKRMKNPIDDDIAYAFTATNRDLIKSSSSGGAFSVIMDGFHLKYGDNSVFVGAAFENTDVVHICAENRSEAERLKKSKYVQSNALGVYRQVQRLLKKGVSVLFSGTPCMVTALKSFLGKDYPNLLTIDIVCHGVPNQREFDAYLSELSNNGSRVEKVEFRNKAGFETECPNSRTVHISYCDGSAESLDIAHCEYLYAFHTGLIYRPSCETCRFASSDRPGDITLGDYWGIEKVFPQLNSLRGVSLIKFNTDKGKWLLTQLQQNGDVRETSWKFACSENQQLMEPAKAHRNRSKFFRLRKNGMSFITAVSLCKRPDKLHEKIIHKSKDILRRVRT